jgi:hypothetical protein
MTLTEQLAALRKEVEDLEKCPLSFMDPARRRAMMGKLWGLLGAIVSELERTPHGQK